MGKEVTSFLLKILEGEFGKVGISRPDLDDIEKFYHVDGGSFWVASVEGRVIGTVGLKDYQGKAYVKRMAVAPDYRGKGVAQVLLKTLTEHAIANHFLELYLSTSSKHVAANIFYLKEGFTRIPTLPVEIPKPIAQIHYIKRL